MVYYIGVMHPDEEPMRNEIARRLRSKFTREVAAQVVDGDLYLCSQSPAAGRFYIQADPGEHGVPEDAETGRLLCVTHVFRTHSWQSDPHVGKWETYDGGGNIVIRIRKNRDEYSKAHAARGAIESALYNTPLGRAVGLDAISKMTNELSEQFGLDPFPERGPKNSTFTLNEDANLRIKKAVESLLSWAPEGGYPDELGKIGADADGVGFARDAEEYASLINGESDGFGKRGTDEPLPLLSQPVYYAIAGSKEAGREFKARLIELMEAAGVEDD